MRKSIKQFVKVVVDSLPVPEPIYEFGALQVAGQEGFADLRPMFAGKEYVGCDMQKGPGVDKVLNLHSIDLPSESVGAVLLLDTLEHVEFVRKATEEVYRILKPDGILITSSVMNFPIHNFPYDYWRFTPEAFKSLLRPFAYSFVDFAGDKHFPHTVVGIGFKGSVPESQMNDFMARFRDWKSYWNNPGGKSLETFVESITPPIIWDLYKTVRYRRFSRD